MVFENGSFQQSFYIKPRRLVISSCYSCAMNRMASVLPNVTQIHFVQTQSGAVYSNSSTDWIENFCRFFVDTNFFEAVKSLKKDSTWCLFYNFKPRERAAVIPPSPAPTTIAVSFIFAINDLCLWVNLPSQAYSEFIDYVCGTSITLKEIDSSCPQGYWLANKALLSSQSSTYRDPGFKFTQKECLYLNSYSKIAL